MNEEQKILKYKGQIIFVNQGEYSVRSRTEYLNFKKGNALLAKCLNYYFETNEEQLKNGAGIEVVFCLR